MSYRVLTTVWLALLLTVTGSSPSSAESCEHKCIEGMGCYGGCTAAGSFGCSAVCGGDACSYRCNLIGVGCDYELRGDCDWEPPAEFSDPSGVGWALLDYSMSELVDVRALAGSSEWLMSHAASRLEQDARPGRWSGVESSGRKSGPKPLPQRRLALYYAPLATSCVPFEHSLEVKRVEAIPAGSGMYFLASTDGAGNLTEVQPVHSRLPGATSALRELVESHLHVWSPSHPTALDLVGFVGIDDSGGVSYGVAGVSETGQ